MQYSIVGGSVGKAFGRMLSGDTPSTQVLGRRGTTLNKYTGTITVNGTAVTDAVYVADDGTISFNWWKAAGYGNDWDNSNTTIVVYNPKITQQP